MRLGQRLLWSNNSPRRPVTNLSSALATTGKMVCRTPNKNASDCHSASARSLVSSVKSSWCAFWSKQATRRVRGVYILSWLKCRVALGISRVFLSRRWVAADICHYMLMNCIVARYPRLWRCVPSAVIHAFSWCLCCCSWECWILCLRACGLRWCSD